MKNLLFVSISFPPKNDPECLQTARYFKYLQQSGKFRITVVTSEIPTLFMPLDESLQKYTSGIHQLIKIRIFENKLVSFALRKLGLGFLLFPDSKMTFYWQWKKVVRQISTKPDYIYSRSNPISSSFMAKRLKEHFKCPWVLHLSDPWALSPLHSIPPNLINHTLKEEFNLLSEADSVTFTTEKTRDIYSKKYQSLSKKFKVLPNVYDPDDASTQAIPKTNKLRIVYTGGLAAKRSISFLLPVLSLASKKIPNLNEIVEFVFAGDIDRENRRYFDDSYNCLKHIGLLSHAKVKELYQTAHLLLVIDNPTGSEGAIFFPSKILDYFLTKRMIWAVTPKHSTTREILSGYRHEAFEHNETDAMCDFVVRCINFLKEGHFDRFESGEIPSSYSAKINASSLADLILSTDR